MKSLYISHDKPLMKREKIFKVVILEDSEFFNNALTQKLRQYASILSMEKNCRFEITSYTSVTDFLKNLTSDTDIVFIDYYLDNNIKGAEVARDVRERCWDCRIVLMSQTRNTETISVALGESMDFLFKDTNVLPRSCFILEDLVDRTLSPYSLN